MQSAPTVTEDIQPVFHPIILDHEISDAWQWLISNLSSRPSLNHPNHCCVYDQKRWGDSRNPTPLLCDNLISCQNIARLFITSQLMGDITDILPLAIGNPIHDIGIFTARIEDSIKGVVRSSKRFRHALSEHLAFWVQFAFAVQNGTFSCFALTPPNFLPEDKGPDGLLLAIDANSRASVELRSVKSSKGNPYYLVASGQFRRTGQNASTSKQLEEFHLISKKGYGFIRLDRLIASAYHSLGIPADQFIRGSILQNSRSFDAMVVADDSYSKYEMFSCYHHISPTPRDCIATYIGSDNWVQVAERIRVQVLHLLKQAEVW